MWCDAVASKEGPPDSTTRLVLLALALRMDREGRAFPSQKHLAEMTGLGRKCVGVHLGKAIKAGWLLLRKRRGPASGHERNEYQLYWPLVVDPDDYTGKPCVLEDEP